MPFVVKLFLFAALLRYDMTVTEIEKTDLQAIDKIVEGRSKIKKEIAKVIVGQEEVIDDLLIALFAKGIVYLWECLDLQKHSS